MKNPLESKLERLDEIAADFIGNTPLIEVSDENREGARILAKLEWHNLISLSVKDRTVHGMLRAAIKEAINKEKDSLHILEYGGGSLAIGLAILGKLLDIPMTLVLPGFVPEDFSKQLTLYGARVLKGDPERNFLGAIEKAQEIAREEEGLTFLHQHRNPANPKAFETGMAVETLSQLDQMGIDSVDAWTAAIGSGGTLIGVYNGLVKKYPSLALYCITPKEMPYGTSQAPTTKPKLWGSGGTGCGIKQRCVETMEEKITGHFYYALEEAYHGMAEYYKKTGVLIGSSSAANLLAAKTIAKDLDKDKVVLTVFPALAVTRDTENLKDYL
uniref:cysteine synthase n=1 Tax=Candidatus Kentrum sp. DK TaxID=2126562 RepID=A0A450TH02_9GAMM|nr:MAG: cysteine synthase A [Candidatus Kentron sp. DK]